jgi:hypothetical protein
LLRLTGPDSEDDRDRPIAQLFYPLDCQPGVYECVKQVSQRVMAHSDPLAHEFAPPW